MNKRFNPMRSARILRILLTLCVSLFIFLTFPMPGKHSRSHLIFELLPPQQWGVGYFCVKSIKHPSSGYYYGVILVRRQVDEWIKLPSK